MKKNKSVINSLSWSFAEKIMTDVIEAIISILLARLLLPEDYGTVSLVQIFITITSIFVNVGLSNALIQKKDADEEQISTVFYINALLGIVLYVGLFLLAPYLAKIKNGSDELTLIIRVLAIKVPVASVYSIQHAYIKKRMEFKLFFFSSFAGTVTAGVVGVYMAFKGYGAWALIASTLTDQIMDCIILFLTTRWFPKFRINIKKSKDIIVFGLQILVTQFITRTYNQLRSLLQGVKYSGADLAFDVKGQKMPNMIINTIEPSVARVLTPILSEKQDDKESLKNTVRKALRYYSFFLCPILVGVGLTASSFIPLLFSKNWQDCVPFIQVYCLARLISTMVIYDDKIVQACGAGKDMIKINIFNVSFDICVIVFVIFVFNSPLSLALSAVFTSFVSIMINCFESKKLVNYSFSDHIKDFCPSLLASIIMGVAVFSVNLFMKNNIYMLIVKVFVGFITYTIVVLMMRLEPTTFIISNIKKVMNRE